MHIRGEGGRKKEKPPIKIKISKRKKKKGVSHYTKKGPLILKPKSNRDTQSQHENWSNRKGGEGSSLIIWKGGG